MSEANDQQITIRIKCMDSSMYDVNISPQQTIRELKEIVSKVTKMYIPNFPANFNT